MRIELVMAKVIANYLLQVLHRQAVVDQEEPGDSISSFNPNYDSFRQLESAAAANTMTLQ